MTSWGRGQTELTGTDETDGDLFFRVKCARRKHTQLLQVWVHVAVMQTRDSPQPERGQGRSSLCHVSVCTSLVPFLASSPSQFCPTSRNPRGEKQWDVVPSEPHKLFCYRCFLWSQMSQRLWRVYNSSIKCTTWSSTWHDATSFLLSKQTLFRKLLNTKDESTQCANTSANSTSVQLLWRASSVRCPPRGV